MTARDRAAEAQWREDASGRPTMRWQPSTAAQAISCERANAIERYRFERIGHRVMYVLAAVFALVLGVPALWHFVAGWL